MKKRYYVEFMEFPGLERKYEWFAAEEYWKVGELEDILKECYDRLRKNLPHWFAVPVHIEREDGEVIFSAGEGKKVLEHLKVDLEEIERKEKEKRAKRPTFEQLWKELHERGSVSFVNSGYSGTVSGWCGVEIKDGKYYHNTDWNLIPISKEEAKNMLQAIVEDPSTVF